MALLKGLEGLHKSFSETSMLATSKASSMYDIHTRRFWACDIQDVQVWFEGSCPVGLL